MGDIHTNPAERPAPAAPPATSPRDEFTLRIPKPGGGGPARAAVKTTEFWLTVGLVFVLLLATYLDEALAREAGWRFATWAIMAYVISRGLAKLGNRSDATHERPANRL